MIQHFVVGYHTRLIKARMFRFDLCLSRDIRPGEEKHINAVW